MMRILGLDVGDRRIGIAISDPLGITAQRLTMLHRGDVASDIDRIATLSREHEAQDVVVGLPLTMQGTIGEQAKRVLEFVEALKERLDCPIHLVDERLTTVQGERALITMDTSRKRRKQLIDQIAAQLILQTYLDAHPPQRY
jgi:putative Holliday junction resolvase